MFSLSEKLLDKINATLATCTMKPELEVVNASDDHFASCDHCKASCSAACKNSCTSLFI